MAKNKKTNKQMIVQKTQHRKQKTKQHESLQKTGGAPEENADSASRVAPVICACPKSEIFQKLSLSL